MADLYQNSQRLMEAVAAGRKPELASSPVPCPIDAVPAPSTRHASEGRPSEVLPFQNRLSLTSCSGCQPLVPSCKLKYP